MSDGSEAQITELEAEMPRGAAEAFLQTIRDPSFGDGAWLDAEDPIVALELGGLARAYPVRVLSHREICHDTVAGEPVVVTYCPLAGAGPVWSRRLDDHELSFIVSGRLYRNTLVMKDEGTGSLWVQVLGRALHGPLAGSRLERIPSSMTTWSAWKKAHPDTLALDPPKLKSPSTYQRVSHADYEQRPGAVFETRERDDRLGPKRWIFGLEHEGDAVAWPLDHLAEAGRLTTQLGEEQAEVTMEAGAPVARWSRAGERVEGLSCYWFSWVEFHPGTRLKLA